MPPLYVPEKANMNYANMIEEKNLKKTFIIATLVSTLVGTFAASHNLYDRLTQKKKDSNQDDAIKKLEDKWAEMAKKKDGDADKKDGGDDKKDVLKDELDKSGRMVKREYDGAYDRLGRRFAAGDILTENELQKQIILLQQTVIGVLEEALYHGRQIDRAGVDKLVWASRAAREGSLDALKGQYQRLAQELPIPRSPSKYVEAEVVELSSRGSSPRRSPVKALPPTATKPLASPRAVLPRAPPPPPLSKPKSGRDFYCRYSVDLQLSPRRLSQAFDPGKGSSCPTCGLNLAVDSADMWEFNLLGEPSTTVKAAKTEKAGGKEKEKDKDRGRSTSGKEMVIVKEQKQKMVRFRVPAKFVVKCHTPEGDYACVLCCGPRGDYSGVVVLCDDPEALVDHVAKDHDASEIEKEIDIIVG